FHPDVLGPMLPPMPYAAAAALFRPEPVQEQWPGTGGDEDPVLLAFLAGAGPMLADFPAAHALEGRRGAELLDRIGPAILVTHSAGGPTGWMTTDARPELVRAHVAIEVMGPPFAVNETMGVSLDWGLTAAPLAYDPPVADPAELRDGSPRRLANVSAAPIAVVTSECSPFAAFDGELVEFLRGAGCDVDLVRLADRGVCGNGHGLMWESNNREALGVVLDWLASRGLT
ncbi:MAG TPA: hypothetical protein VHB30_00875, partial [Solirubrobacteraceae bacterium]|nr:hypothetical protein [Solirubrobacteraceae bacterium]